MTNKRFDFGVKMDLLSDIVAKKIQNRVTDVRDQAVRLNYVDLDTQATEMYNRAYDLFAQGRYRYEPKFTGERYNLLAKAAGLLVLTYRYDKVKWEVTTALKSGTSVAVFSPYKDPDMVKLHSVAQWETLCDREANADWATWADELPINLDAVLDTPTPWLPCPTLRDAAKWHPDFEAFLEYVNAEMHEIEAEGEWDVDVSYSPVYNEKASVWHNPRTSTSTKLRYKENPIVGTWIQGQQDSYQAQPKQVLVGGQRQSVDAVGTRYKYGKKEYWYNYEVLPVDVLTKYLHLSYLHSISYKPLQRIASDGADYGTRKYFEFLSESDLEDGQYEQGLTVTPMYEDPYFHGDDRFDSIR